jgi:hypothetical protein
VAKALADVPKFRLGKTKLVDDIFAELVGEKLPETTVSNIHPTIEINAGVGKR